MSVWVRICGESRPMTLRRLISLLDSTKLLLTVVFRRETIRQAKAGVTFVKSLGTGNSVDTGGTVCSIRNHTSYSVQ
jgi:hypothetical protein